MQAKGVTADSIDMPFVPLPADVALVENCSEAPAVIAQITSADRVTVLSSLAGGAQSCYKVRIIRAGVPVEGYVIGPALAAIEKFEADHGAARRSALAAIPVAAVPASSEAATKPPPFARFQDFSAVDATGHRFQLSRLQSKKVILVTFWSPRSRDSLRNLKALAALHDEYSLRGLAAVGISTERSASRLSGFLDDTGVSWPQIPDRANLAATYNVDPASGTTFVLDSQLNVVAASADPKEVAEAARKLLGR